jgi:hypothetical protein
MSQEDMFTSAILFQTQFSDWCDTLITRAIELAAGPVTVLELENSEALVLEMMQKTAPNMYLRARRPMHWLRGILKSTAKKFVIGLDDPRHAVTDFVSRHNIELPEATRRAATASTLMTSCFDLPGALVIYAEQAAKNPVATAAMVVEHLGLPMGAEGLETLVGQLPTDVIQIGCPGMANLSDREQEIVNAALLPLAEMFAGNPLHRIIWHRELFLEEHHLPVSGPLPLKGPIRYMIYGPYIVLPPGRWMAEMVLGFSEDAMQMTYKVEVWAGSLLTSASLTPQMNIMTVNLVFEIATTNEHLVEIRLLNLAPGTRGTIALGQTTLTKIQEAELPMVSIIKNELDLLGDQPRY